MSGAAARGRATRLDLSPHSLDERRTPMNGIGRSLPLFSASLIFALGACSGSGGGGGGTMYIETCNLGCESGQGGIQVSCEFNQVALNQEIAVYFSEPVDPASVTSATIQLQDVGSGASAAGLRFVDPNDPRKVLFRPSVTVALDGSVSFGFRPDSTYRIRVPGTAQGDGGPYVTSRGGKQNESRLACDVLTVSTPVDYVPGAPNVSVFVQQAIVGTPDPTDNIAGVPAAGAVDVWRNSTIRFSFDDVINPVTLANPITGQSTFVTVQVDVDGDLATTADRVTLFGNYTVQLDLVSLRTFMTFTPTSGMPSSGDLSISPTGLPRKVVVTIPSTVQDLAGNALANAQTLSFVPEYVQLDPVTLPDADGENFTNTNNLDGPRSGAAWGAGKLTRGYGGGRGRLGDLRVPSGAIITLDTDSTTFPLDPAGIHDVMTNLTPVVDYDPSSPLTQPSIAVTDGIFEFTNLQIDPNGTLLIRGSRPARIFTRGNTNIQGLIDISGQTPAPYASNSTLGGPGGLGGPNAGKGGDGATRFDSGGTNLITVLGVDVPDADVRVDGQRGVGVGRVDFIGAGFGGQHFPAVTPLSVDLTPPSNGDLRFSNIGGSCLSAQVSFTGGGGAYATDGQPGVPATSPPTNLDGASNLPPPGSSGGGGPASDVGLEAPTAPPVIRKLTAELGYLRGGSGGGGGGAHLFGTESAGLFPTCDGPGFTISIYRDHSAAGGGGGGGAMQLACGGSSFSLSGLIDAGGGDGGSAPAVLPGEVSQAALRPKRTSPGGGGSGGAIRLQAVNMPDAAFTTATPPRLAIDGGVGGANSLNGRGGAGGAGLIRLEGLVSSPTAAALAPLLNPTSTAIVGTNAINVLSIGTWAPPRFRPETYSGATSCWMKPDGNFFQIVFKEDDPGATNPADRFGWDMDVLWGTGGGTFSYRNPANSPFPGVSIEQQFGNLFEAPGVTGSYITVRFQGARAIGALADPCSVNLNSQVIPGSVTPWVSHPKDLNAFTPRPNMIRFTVTFDSSLAVPGMQQAVIQGVTNLRIRTQPD